MRFLGQELALFMLLKLGYKNVKMEVNVGPDKKCFKEK